MNGFLHNGGGGGGGSNGGVWTGETLSSLSGKSSSVESRDDDDDHDDHFFSVDSSYATGGPPRKNLNFRQGRPAPTPPYRATRRDEDLVPSSR